MYRFPIGVMVDSFRTDFVTAVTKASQLGAEGLQMYCTKGAFAPENMTTAKTAEVLNIVKSRGLKFSAICGDLGHGFGNRAENAENVEKSKRIMELAKMLECDIVTTLAWCRRTKMQSAIKLCRRHVLNLPALRTV